MKKNDNLKPFENRAMMFEIRTEDTENGGIIEGQAIVYDSPTDMSYYREIIENGALNNSDLKDVRFMVNHDLSKIPLARSRNNNENSTMQLIVNENGLAVRVALDVENNTDASSLYSAVKRGDITGMSFMFSINDEEWEDLDTDYPTRRIKEIGKVVEVSAVTFPAYTDTTINARSREVLESARSALENVRQQRAKSLESDEDTLILLKEKTKLLGGF